MYYFTFWPTVCEVIQFLQVLFYFFKDLFKNLFYFLGEGREIGQERNISMWLPLAPLYRGPGPQPRPRIELVTLWFAGPHSIHWATPARASFSKLSPAVGVVTLFSFSHLNRFVGIVPCAFSLHLPKADNVKCLFMCVFTVCVPSSSVKYVHVSFCHFLTELFTVAVLTTVCIF